MIIDLNGNILASFSQSYNMQLQFPTNSLSLFNGMIGVASSFTLFDSQLQLPVNTTRVALVKLKFGIWDPSNVPSSVQDYGKNQGKFGLIKAPSGV